MKEKQYRNEANTVLQNSDRTVNFDPFQPMMLHSKHFMVPFIWFPTEPYGHGW